MSTLCLVFVYETKDFHRGLVYLLCDFYAHCSRTFIECDYLSLREHKEIIYQERKKKRKKEQKKIIHGQDTEF